MIRVLRSHLCLVVFALLLQPGLSAAQQRAATVFVDAIAEQEFSGSADVIGRIISLQSGPATSEISGQISALTAEVGDRVQAGQSLASLS